MLTCLILVGATRLRSLRHLQSAPLFVSFSILPIRKPGESGPDSGNCIAPSIDGDSPTQPSGAVISYRKRISTLGFPAAIGPGDQMGCGDPDHRIVMDSNPPDFLRDLTPDTGQSKVAPVRRVVDEALTKTQKNHR